LKKILCCLLAIVMVILSIPIQIKADSANEYYSAEQIEAIYTKYCSNESMMEVLFNDNSDIAYWNLIDNVKKNEWLTGAIDWASKIIDEYPDKKDYVEILTNLIVMQEGELAEQIETQSEFDNLQNTGDYTWDMVECASIFLGDSKIFENVTDAIESIGEGGEAVIDGLEQAEYYEAIIKSYSRTKKFLDAVAKYAKDKELRDAATKLMSGNEELLKKRLEYFIDTTDIMIEYGAEFFVENFSFVLLKSTDLYLEDETVKWYVDCGEELSDSISNVFGAGKFAFKMTMLAGNIGFGTDSTFNRYQEMKVVSEIAEALIEANGKIVVSNNSSGDVVECIKEKCDYYKMLITTHARGEYLVYQLLTNDAGLLSQFRVLFDYFKEPEDTTDSWYDNQISVMIEYYDIVNGMFDISQYELINISGDSKDTEDGINKENVQEDLIEELYVLKSTTQYSAQGNVILESEYQYDECGNNVTRISVKRNEKGSGTNREEMEYDKDGNLIKGINYDEDGEVWASYHYTYNTYGNIEMIYFENHTTKYRTETKYIYDEKRILMGVEVSVFANDKFEGIYGYKYEYDVHGNIKKEIVNNENGSMFSWTEYEYDDLGNVVKAIGYDGISKNMTWWEEYEYDYIQVSRDVLYENANELSKKDIVDAIYRAGCYTWNWFWDSSRDHVDESDTYIVLGEEGYNTEYKRVTYEGITTVEDVVTLTKQYYTEEVARDLILYKQWYENGNKLYVSEPDGLGGIEADYYEVIINRDSDTQYTLTITEYFQGEILYEAYDVHYILVDGYWVFDQSITISDMDKCEIHVKNAEEIDFISSIPPAAVEFNGHYYYIYEGQPDMDWNSAQEFCKECGGYLATITDAEEDEFLYSYITNYGYDSAMFGLTNQYDSDVWRWGTGEDFIYKNWCSGEPNNQGGYEHYGMYYKKIQMEHGMMEVV